MKKIVLLNILMFVGYFLSAQEIGFYLGGGLSGQQYKSEKLSSSLKPGGHIGISYAYYFSPKFGIATGVELGLYRNQVSLNEDYQYTRYIVNDKGNAFEYRIQAKDYEEQNRFTALAIPIMLQYRFGKKAKFYINAGSKIIIPQQVNSEAEATEIALSGYFPDKGALITDMPQHGFGLIDQWKDEAKVSQKLSATLSLEAGMYFNIKENARLYAGFYFDYGLSNMQKDPKLAENQPFVSYSSKGIEHSEFNSVLSTGIDKVNLLAYGVQLKYTFGRKRIKQAKSDSEDVLSSTPLQPVEPQVEAKPEEPVQVEQEEQVQPEVKQEVEPEIKEPVEEEKPIETVSKPTENKPVEDIPASLTLSEKQQIENSPINVVTGIGSLEITVDSKRQLDRVAVLLNKYKDIELDLIGHTCDLGTDEINQRIGMQRASNVEKYLVSKGVARHRLHKYSKESSQPLYPNTSESNRQKNRRVELKVKDL